jgi:formate--tetrahydrofolate ligase
VASEIMAIFCLSNDLNEMRERINNIIVAYSYDNKAIYVKDLEITNAIMKILEYAVMPNTVQTLEENLCIVHGGPFANIAHGCNSVIGTKTALSLGDYVVTEAGFASDLGAEKFLDIVCDNAKLNPNAVVIVASTRSLKMHGNVEKDNLKEENIPALNDGIKNLEQHINNIKAFGLPFVVCINQMDISLPSEIAALEQ